MKSTRAIKRNRIRIAVNVFIAIAVFASWLSMALHGEGTLADTGLRSLKYFTMQSNILAGVAAIVWLVKNRGSAGLAVSDGPQTPEGSSATTGTTGAEKFKYVAAAAVLLTFTTVMVFLGPIYGYRFLFTGPNLWLHLIVPLVAGAEMMFLSDADFTRRDNLLVILPPLIYGIGYIGNTLINGIGTWPDTNDWYAFLTWGYPVGMLIFVIIGIVTWLLGLLMRMISAALHR